MASQSWPPTRGLPFDLRTGRKNYLQAAGTLERTAPETLPTRDRATGEYLVDAKSIAAFRAQLLRKADKMGARMIEYDAQKGEWTIEVAHF